MLSNKKQQFMASENKEPYQINAAEAKDLIDRYNKKHNIKIFFNGETDYGQEKIKITQKNTKKTIEDLENNHTKYAIFLKKFWLPTGYQSDKDLYISETNPAYSKIKNTITKFLDEKGGINPTLSDKELDELNILSASPEIAEILDKKIKSYVETFKEQIEDCCLSKSEAVEEMKIIQKNLKDDEVVGYFFSNNHRSKADHFDIFLISKNAIIKPHSWNVHTDKTITTGDLPDLYEVKLHSKRLNNTNKLMPVAQSQLTECGTLGLLYLKELLKNNASQFKKFTLMSPYYWSPGPPKEPQLRHFFIPSPQVLSYSQSQAYNRILEALFVDSTEPIKITHKDDSFEIRPLKKVLTDAIKEATNKNDKETIQKCNQLLKELPTFGKLWLEELKKANIKREAMASKEEVNAYLAYRTQDLGKHAHESKSSKDEKPPSPDYKKIKT